MSGQAGGLSVCCLTADEPAMVARMLGTVRDVADDIVVAVDSRFDPGRLSPLADVADTLVRFEYADPPERQRPWLVSLCRNDTVLMLDGDEVPSAALIAQLPVLAGDRSVTQVRLARRWCFPDAAHWLAERPWWPDYQRRLFRVGPDLDFDLRVHGGVRGALPARYADEPLYHLACVLGSFADRRQRVRRYEADRPGLVAVGGGPMNDTLYVPEHFATLRPQATPDEDVRMLTEVLGAAHASQDTSSASRPDVPLVTAEEIASHAPADPLEVQGYRARLRVVERDRRTEPGNDTYLAVEVVNEGLAPIPHRDSPGVQVRLAARLVDAGGAAVVDWSFTSLPCDIPGGEGRLMEALIRIPDKPGAHGIEIDLVNERSRWFGCTARSDLLVATRWGRYAP